MARKQKGVNDSVQVKAEEGSPNESREKKFHLDQGEGTMMTGTGFGASSTFFG